MISTSFQSTSENSTTTVQKKPCGIVLSPLGNVLLNGLVRLAVVYTAFYGSTTILAQDDPSSEFELNTEVTSFQSIQFAVSVDGQLVQIPKFKTMSIDDLALPNSRSLIRELNLESVREELRIGSKQREKLRGLENEICLPRLTTAELIKAPNPSQALLRELSDLDKKLTNQILAELSVDQLSRIKQISSYHAAIREGFANWSRQFQNQGVETEQGEMEIILNRLRSEIKQDFAAFRKEVLEELELLMRARPWGEIAAIDFDSQLADDPVLFLFQLDATENALQTDELAELFAAANPRFLLSPSTEIRMIHEHRNSTSELFLQLLSKLDIMESQTYEMIAGMEEFRREAGGKLETEMQHIRERIADGDSSAISEAGELIRKFESDEILALEKKLLVPQRKYLRTVGLSHAVRVCGPWYVLTSFRCSEIVGDDVLRKKVTQMRLRQLEKAQQIIEVRANKSWGEIKRDCPFTARMIESKIGPLSQLTPLAKLMLYYWQGRNDVSVR